MTSAELRAWFAGLTARALRRDYRRGPAGVPGGGALGLNAPPEAPAAKAPKAVCGLRPFPKRGGIVTNELIDKLRKDDAY